MDPLRKSVWLALLTITPCLNVVAAQNEEQEMAALMALLNEETEIATQNKMNADYVPGMVTVLHGEEMLAVGATTVVEALDHVAGFYVSVNNAGDPVTIVRGVGAALNTNNLKILINGVAVNRPVDASAEWALKLPLTQVDRIEVIRGPGSALYGEYAFSSVVNIITRTGSGVSVGMGSDNLMHGDLLYQGVFASGAQVKINMSAWDKDDSGDSTGVDSFYSRGLGHSPGTQYNHEKGQWIWLSAGHHGYELRALYAGTERGGWFGRNAVIPMDLEPRKETISGLGITKTWKIQDGLDIEFAIDTLNTELQQAAYLVIPAGADRPGTPPGTELIPEDFFRRDGNEDVTQRAHVDLHWILADRHRLYMDASYNHTEVESSFIYLYELEQPPLYGSPDEVLVLNGSDRELSSITVQDQWQLHRKLELTLGVRYDHYDDWGSNSSPRIAAVWRASDQNIIKLQYAEAFRPPTLAEQYPGPNTIPGAVFTPLSAEQLDSYEVSYIHRSSDYIIRTTLFYTHVADLIEFYLQPGQPPLWRNRGDIDTSGVELEWSQQISHTLEWNANVSYVHAKDQLDQDKVLAGSVDWLANIELSWRTANNVGSTLRGRYVGSQEGWELGPMPAATDEFNRYFTFDYTFLVERLMGVTGLSLRASVKNMTDRKYRTLPNPAQYPNGLLQGGRTGILQLNYDF